MITPERLGAEQSAVSVNLLQDLRDQIDQIDQSWVQLLGRRFALTEKIGELKAQHHLSSVDANREAEQAKQLRNWASQAEVDADLILHIHRQIVTAVVARHQEIEGK